MGQSNWAWGCALIIATIVADRLTAQDAGPFAESAAKPDDAKNVDAERPSPADAQRRTEAILDEPLRAPFDFPGLPLNQISQQISEEYGLPVVFDVKALDAIGASSDVEVTASLNNLSLRSALDLLLTQVDDLDYVVDNEVLLITSQKEAALRVETRVYRVDDLIVADPSQSALRSEADYDSLIELITSNVERESWRENGTGGGELKRFRPGMLVITQTRRTHREVENLLGELRRTKAAIVASSASQTPATQPVTRSFRFTDDSIAESEQIRSTVQEALIRSVDWETPDALQVQGEVFLHVLPEQVLVRHLPPVVEQIGQVVQEITGGQPTGGGGRGGRRGSGSF